MPMTPWCQRSLARTMGPSGFFPSSLPRASFQISVSMLWRCRFSSQSWIGGHGGLAQAARGVQTRREAEADAGGADPRRIHAGLPQHGGEARTGIAGQHFKPPPHQIAIFVHQGHHICHGAHGDKIPIALQHGFIVALAGADQLQRHAYAAEIRVGIAVALLLAVDDGQSVRQGAGLALMVIGDDHVHPDTFGVLCLFHGGDAAVHGDEQGHAVCAQRVQGGAVEPIALLVAIGNIAGAAQPLPAQIVRQQAGGGDAVHIIVSVDGDGLLPGDGAADALHRGGHALHLHRVMQNGDVAVQQGVGLLRRPDAPQGQNSGKQRPAARLPQRSRVFRPCIWYFPLQILHTFPLYIFLIESFYQIPHMNASAAGTFYQGA